MGRTKGQARWIVGLCAVFVLAPCARLFGQVVPIIELHRNDQLGMPKAPYTEGTQVTVTGIATVGTGTYGSNLEIFVQDPTGGVCVFGHSDPTRISLGDSITVTGVIKSYYGLVEVYGYPSNPLRITLHGSGYPVPEPLVLTCAQVANSFLPDGSEPYEGRLIRVNSVTYTQTGTYGGLLRDATGTCDLFIDKDTGIPHPSGVFDVVGILKQYDQTSPFTSGYEVSPRYREDIISRSGPQIVWGPMEADIDPDAVTIVWDTDTPATSLVRFGRTTGYELGSVGDSTLVLHHAVRLSGLSPATFYHSRILSTNAVGTTQGEDLLFSTASPPECSGEIVVYFTKSINPAYATGTVAHGEVDVAQRLADRINAARYSIDFCFYNLTHTLVSQALVAAKARGVSVRVITERDNLSNQIADLVAAGIPVIDDTFGSNDGTGYMHNKFAVFDYRNTTSAADDWVWTGSYNASYAGVSNNAENVLVIQDQALAACYTVEFNEMWGSENETPDPATARFGARKEENTPHRFAIGGRLVEQYMSPSDRTTGKIIRALNTAQTSIYFCIYSFTRYDVASAMRDKWYYVPGFKLKGVFDSAEARDASSQFGNMAGTGSSPWSPKADVWIDLEAGLLHHKYAIVDVYAVESDPLVVTGSHNWTTSAETINDENTLIIHDADIANQFLQEFAQRYRAAGGRDDLRTQVEPTLTSERVPREQGYALSSFYPNPFSQSTHVTVSIPRQVSAAGRSGETHVAVYDVRGREIAVLHRGPLPAGEHSFHWDGVDGAGRRVGPGVYFCVLEAEGARVVQKVSLLR
ncbi:MAG: phospholipase D-like domain-containing protein [candidate division KSB1 bacterium]|nr:phospholipase D-like domain-containing protein [candidate division KSB1 bacterium]